MAKRIAVGDSGWIELSAEVKNLVMERVFQNGETANEALLNVIEAEGADVNPDA